MITHLKWQRVKKNLTQQQLAEKVGASRQTIHAIETGNYNLSTLLALKIAHCLQVSVSDLFELENTDWFKS